MDEVGAELLAISDGGDAGIFLLLEPDQRRVALGLVERRAFELPFRSELLGLGQPTGLREAAGDGGGEEHAVPPGIFGEV